MKRGQIVKKIIFSLVVFAAALILSYAYPEAKEIGKVKIKIATVSLGSQWGPRSDQGKRL
jgi:hypothetical protein